VSLSCISVLFVKLYIFVVLLSIGIDVCLIGEEGNGVWFLILAWVCWLVTSILLDIDIVLFSFKVVVPIFDSVLSEDSIFVDLSFVKIDVFPVSKIELPTIVFDWLFDEDIDSLFDVVDIDSLFDIEVDSLFDIEVDSLFDIEVDSLFEIEVDSLFDVVDIDPLFDVEVDSLSDDDIDSLFDVVDIDSLFDIEVVSLFDVVDIDSLFDVVEVDSLFDVVDIGFYLM